MTLKEEAAMIQSWMDNLLWLIRNLLVILILIVIVLLTAIETWTWFVMDYCAWIGDALLGLADQLRTDNK